MADTPKLDMILLEETQAQKHVTVNEALWKLDGLVQMTATTRTATTEDDLSYVYSGTVVIVPAGAGGAWAGQDGNVAHEVNGGWEFYEPEPGWRAWVEDEGREVVFDGTSWVEAPRAGSPNGAASTLAVVEEALTLSGASVTSTVVIPNGAIVFAVSARTTAAITGATSYAVGIAGEPAKFGDLLGVAAGSVNFGAIGPQAFYADTPVVVTANGGDFTGGEVRIAIHHLAIRPPQS